MRAAFGAGPVFADAGLTDVDTELQQFAVNMRCAPSGFARLSMRINSRTSFGTAGRPDLPWRIFHLQNRPKPLWCQPMTVAAWKMESRDCQPSHREESQTQR